MVALTALLAALAALLAALASLLTFLPALAALLASEGLVVVVILYACACVGHAVSSTVSSPIFITPMHYSR